MTAIYDQLVERYRSGAWTAHSNRLQGAVEPPRREDIARMPAPGTAEYRALKELGRRAVDNGEVGALILSGGMATRFNYDHPKGLYPILDGTSFLELKIRWIREVAPTMPLFIMTSFHTDRAVRAHLAERHEFGAAPGQLVLFEQGRFRRLTPQGEYFSSPDGHEDYAAPGHGDFVGALQRSGCLAKFLATGGKTLLFSNVDNLGASLDLAILGWHLHSGLPMTVEVAAKRPGDKGGAPARVDGRMQLVEGFAFPTGFDQDRIPVFNTATYAFAAQALTEPHELPWYVVEKTVAGQPVIQFEQLAGDLSAQLETAYLEVERDERFIPVKSQEDVPTAQDLIRTKRAAVTCA